MRIDKNDTTNQNTQSTWEYTVNYPTLSPQNVARGELGLASIHLSTNNLECPLP